MKVSDNFVLQEFIDPVTYSQFGDSSIWFIDKQIVLIAQYIRENLNKSVTINNWHSGGSFKESGLRRFDTETGGKMSQHKFGRAIDIKVADHDSTLLYMWLVGKWDDLSELGLTTVEDVKHTPTWLHLDTRWTGLDNLKVVTP